MIENDSSVFQGLSGAPGTPKFWGKQFFSQLWTLEPLFSILGTNPPLGPYSAPMPRVPGGPGPETGPGTWPRRASLRRAHGARLTERRRRVDLTDSDPFLKCEMDRALFWEYCEFSEGVFEH